MKKIFIAVLSYDGKIEIGCSNAILSNIRMLEKYNYEVVLHYECGNCYIAQARNMCVALFLESGFDYLVFVDSDLSFDSNAIYRMVQHEKDVICGAYPFRTGDLDYPIKVICYLDKTPLVDLKTGLIAIESGPTGLMVIKRSVINELINKNPTWKTNHTTKTLGSYLYAIFDTGILREPNKWYGEDYLFCMRCKDHNFNLWLEPDITFDHIGKSKISGNYHEYLLQQPKPMKGKE